MRQINRLFLLVLLFVLQGTAGFGQKIFEITPGKEEFGIGKYVEYLLDTTTKISLDQIIDGEFSADFIPSNDDVLFLGITRNAHWFKIKIRNNIPEKNDWLLVIKFEQLGYVDFYEVANGSVIESVQTGFKYPLNQRPVNSTDFAFPLKLGDNDIHEYLIRIESDRTVVVPFFLSTSPEFEKYLYRDNIGYGIYFGIVLGLFLYNLFLYFGLRDKVYLYYLFSLFASALVMSTLSADLYEFILPNNPDLSRKMMEAGPALVAIATAMFAKEFLKIKQYSTFFYWFLNILIAISTGTLIIIFFGYEYQAQFILYNVLSIQILVLLASGVVSWRKNYKYAGLFIIAWLGYMVGGLITMGRDLGFLAFNYLTTHAVEFGSAMEVVLLAMALSARYNDYRKEKEAAIQHSLDVQKEATETLEQKVKERTAALNSTLKDLKDAQGQLVLAEKMASLGQLTAGVAHEINNPINFVSANIEPLKLNLEDLIHSLERNPELIDRDLKYTIEETKDLLKIMEDGTRRTADIVKGLRNFSRMDESDQKDMQINECIESTLLMIHSLLAQNNISVEKNLGGIPEFEANPGQLNQVFMNLFTNAIDAINENKDLKDGEKKIFVSTEVENNGVKISIKDTGIGMSVEVKEKIFDPFFTTKDVGKGTGLGLSISYGIIERHNGSIEVRNGENGIGTEFIVTIPFSKAGQKD